MNAQAMTRHSHAPAPAGAAEGRMPRGTDLAAHKLTFESVHLRRFVDLRYRSLHFKWSRYTLDFLRKSKRIRDRKGLPRQARSAPTVQLHLAACTSSDEPAWMMAR